MESDQTVKAPEPAPKKYSADANMALTATMLHEMAGLRSAQEDSHFAISMKVF
jgi:hypothetical protein